MQDIILTPTTKEDLLSEFRAIVKEEMLAVTETKLQALYISSKEARNLFSPAISESTLWNWVNAGRINKYNVGGKVVYKYSEIINAVETITRYKKDVA